MNKEFQNRLIAWFLVLLTAAAVTLAAFNVAVEPKFQIPYDGVWWVEHQGQLVAERVRDGSPGQHSGIKAGDVLVAVNRGDVSTVAALTRELFSAGLYSKTTYTLRRSGVALDSVVILEPADRSLNQWLRGIALIYLGIGLYVLLRRWTSYKSTHFFFFCLVSFVFYAFKFTGKLNLFDWTIYWSNVVAWALQPALFLHFVLTFPARHTILDRRRWLPAAIYVPGAVLLAVQIVALTWLEASEHLRWNLDRLQMVYLATYFGLAAWILMRQYTRATNVVLRQQMKWVTRGTVLAIAPFTVFYVLPYVMGWAPVGLMKFAVVALGLLPLTFGYAIFRYRLMDVDLIFKRGMAYTLAAAAIAGVYFASIAFIAEVVHASVPGAGQVGLIAAIAITALVFDPLKNWITEKIDQAFYRQRYDYRQTLITFGRDLSAETDLDHMLHSVVEYMAKALIVDRVALFIVSEDGAVHLSQSFGIPKQEGLDLAFLTRERAEGEAGHIFFDNTHQAVRESDASQQAIGRLDLNYYIPCRAQHRPVAFLGLGKTREGDFLSSEDVELLETLAGYIGIAIQNAQLYTSLQRKAEENERLKEFNENIVESISIGVLAVDLSERIESWNSQMEVMYALPRAEALGRTLSDVFPPAFVDEFHRVRQGQGIHNLYKFRLGTPTGETRITNVAIAPLVARDLNVIGRLIIVDDISERLELEAQVAQADKLSSVGLLAAGVAHEVNTPLAVISSYAQMLTKQAHGDEKLHGVLEKITQQTFRASEIVNNLLNFSRTSGTEFGEVNLNRVIQDTLALLEHQMRTSRVTVIHSLAAELPEIFGNTGRLQQVFLNLILNARDAMPNGGTLHVSTVANGSVQAIISDSGTGIAPEHLARIYDPFFTTKNGTREGQPRGTGLGLAVTYGIIQEHAGKIRVESTPGAGTAFHLDFPAVRKAVHV